MQSVSWNVRPSTSTGRCAVRRRPLQERHGAQDRAVALPRPCAVRGAAVEDEIGVDARRRTRRGRRSPSARRRTRRPAGRAGANPRAPRGCRSRGSAPPRGRRTRRRRRRAVRAQSSSTARIAASPPFMSAAPRPITRVPSSSGSWSSQGGTVSRWPTSATASSRSPTRATSALPRRSTATPGSARQRASTQIGQRGLLARHARDGDELEREPREGLRVGRQRISSSRRSALRSGPSAPASSMDLGDPTRPGLLPAGVLAGAQRDLGGASASVARRRGERPICASPRMRAAVGEGSTPLSRSARTSSTRSAGEHRLGARRDARAQLRPRPRHDRDERRPPHAAAPQAVALGRQARSLLRELERRARRGGGRWRAGARRRAGRVARARPARRSAPRSS